jgi:hypothetical protein
MEKNGRGSYTEAYGASAARVGNDNDPVAKGYGQTDRCRHARQGEAKRLYPTGYRGGVATAGSGIEEEAAKVSRLKFDVLHADKAHIRTKYKRLLTFFRPGFLTNRRGRGLVSSFPEKSVPVFLSKEGIRLPRTYARTTRA